MDLGSRPGSAPKKKKRVEPAVRLTGVTREVQALMGDSVPPIAIIEQKTYKSKPSIAQKLFKPRHWEERSFQHGGRNDGLVLQHWKRSIPGSNRAPTITTPTDVEMEGGQKEPTQVQATEMRFEDEFPSDKWNVNIPIEIYTDEQYEESFKSEDWTKEETDYLMQLCKELDLRWVLIADRYTLEDIPGEVEYPDRTMELMKSRYYAIAAKLMEIHTPASNMTASEFQLWEKMRNFDAKTEKARKEIAEKLFERTKDEAEEEKILLEELHRITKNEEDFIKLRRDLYSRLESAPAIRRTERGEEQSTAMYQTSAGLSMLLQSLLAKERKLKRPQMPNGEHLTPVDQKRGQPNQYSRRETMDSQADDGPQKKGSTSQPIVRTLTPGEEIKFGVAHPTERLTSGVQFRHEKINRLTMAKSQVQTSKMQAALIELGIPPRLLMPTERVCREFERLVNSIHLLLDARKVSDKVKSEIQVLEEARRIRLGQPKEGEEAGGDAMEVDTSQVVEDETELADESNVADDQEQDDEDRDAEGEDEDVEGEKDEEINDSMQVDDEDEEGAGSDQEFAQEEDDEEDGISISNLGNDNDDEEVEDSDAGDQEVTEAGQSEAGNDSDAGVEDGGEADSDAEAEDEDDEDEEEEEEGEEEGEEEEEEEEEEEDQADDDGEAEQDNEEPSRPSSSHSAVARLNKRSASVISEASRAGSNRSALSRKKRK